MSDTYPDPVEQSGGVTIISIHEDGALALVPMMITLKPSGQIVDASALTLIFRVKSAAIAKPLGAHPSDARGRSLSLTKAEAASIADGAAWALFDETDPASPIDQGKGIIRKYR